MNNQDEVREEWYRECGSYLSVNDVKGIADFFLSKFDTLLAKKREATQELFVKFKEDDLYYEEDLKRDILSILS